MRETAAVRPCLKCGDNMVLKNKGEKYRLSCQGYPNCKEVVWLPSAIVKAEEVGGDRCRRCNALQLQFSFGMPIELGE